MATNERVLVTGGTGYLGTWCIVYALERGYRVRTTIRSLKRADEVRKSLKTAGVTQDQADSVEFAAADLTSDDGWPDACKDCTYVLHVASPLPHSVPKDPEAELIRPAKEGTLRVLKAAKNAGSVKRVVLTSSFAAIGYGHGDHQTSFTEQDWTPIENPASPVMPYPKSKTVAERAAWDWASKDGGDLELVAINAVMIQGPFLGKSNASSVELVSRLVNGKMPGVPQLSHGVVDVRDCADLHILAILNPNAKNERFIATSDDGFMSTLDLATKLKHGLGDKGKKIPTRELPNMLLKFVGLFGGVISLITPELGKKKSASNEKARRILGWQPRPTQETLLDTAVCLDRFGLVE